MRVAIFGSETFDSSAYVQSARHFIRGAIGTHPTFVVTGSYDDMTRGAIQCAASICLLELAQVFHAESPEHAAENSDCLILLLDKPIKHSASSMRYYKAFTDVAKPVHILQFRSVMPAKALATI